MSEACRAILTINFNGALCDNSRRSMQAAARRWGCDFWEINEATPWRLPMAPGAYKTAAFARSDYDEVFILDADVIVSGKCPNPFETFPLTPSLSPSEGERVAKPGEGSPLIAVRNGSARFGDLWQVKAAEAYEVAKLQRQDARFAGLPYSPATYFNTGMLLAKRAAHAAMFALAHEVCHVDHGLGWIDQTPLNLAALACGVPVNLVDERWNFIHGQTLGADWKDLRRHDVYVLHFAGETGREMTLPQIVWE